VPSTLFPASPGTSITLLLDTLAGGAMMHALTTPASRRVDLAGNTGRYATRLVDFLLSEKPRR
jgi:hypothetical protein